MSELETGGVPPKRIVACVHAGTVYFPKAVPEIPRAFTLPTSKVVERGGRYRIEWSVLPPYTSESLEGQRMLIPLGYWPRCQRILEDAGYTCVIQDWTRDCDHFETAALDAPGFDDESRVFLDAIRGRRRGLWVAGPGERDRRIADFCRFYCDAKITVVCSRQRRARRLRRWLERELGEAVGLEFRAGWSFASDDQKRVPRIYIKSPAGLYSLFRDQHQIAIVADAENATGEHYFTACRSMSLYWPHMIGLIPPAWTSRSLHRSRNLEWLFGVLLQPHPAPTGPTVIVMKSGGANAPDRDGARDRRRALYTLHAQRNAKIARIARAIRGGDLDTLLRGVPRELHPDLERACRCRSVAVLCEDSEQAAELESLLRRWDVLRYGDAIDLEPAGGECFLCTPVYAAVRGIASAVVIRASGGGGPPDVKWLGDRPERFVIDFDDRFHARAISDTRRRLAGYHACGWSVYGVTAARAARPPGTG